MKTPRFISSRAWGATILSLAALAHAGMAATPPTGGSLLDPASIEVSAFDTEQGASVSQATAPDGSPAIEINLPGASQYPGVDFPIPGGSWDLSQYSGIEITLANLSQTGVDIALRVDNPGNWKNSPWNTQNTWLPAGKTKTLKLTFGESYGNPGFNLNPAQVKRIKLFAANPKGDVKLLVTSLKAVGPPSSYSATTAAPPQASASPAKPAATAPVKGETLVAISDASLASIDTENGASASIVDVDGSKAVQFDFPKSSTYPGINFVPPAGAWNLSQYGGVQTEITNSSSKKVGVVVRVDNPGNWKKSPWNSEVSWMPPGSTRTITVTFGQSYGHPGYALDSSRVSNIKVCVDKPSVAGNLIVKYVKAVGTPTSAAPAQSNSGSTATVASGDEANLNAPPISGELFPLDGNVNLAQLKTQSCSVSLDKSGPAPVLKAVFHKNKYPNVQFPCPKGGWNLHDYKGIEVTLTNQSDKKVRVGLRVDNRGDWKKSPWNTELSELKAGETKTLQMVFGEENGAPAFPLDSGRVSAIQVFLISPREGTTILMSNLKGYGSSETAGIRQRFSNPEDRNVAVTPPDWLGERPPVEGDWVMTLDEEFDGDSLDLETWNTRFVWDGPAKAETQRYIKENISVKDGVMSIKCEVNPGHQYNDPNLPTRKYATATVTSYDKWTQKYGYIEARLKLPTARGLWPAFWMMPDRGAESGLDVWQRRTTENKHGRGMEIDIMEHLTEWGPGRTNIATHWGGYGSNHKRWGTNHVYYGPTDDGWHVFGLLWEPTKLSWYIDGVKKGEWESDEIIDVPTYLLINVQMGNWATKDVDEANLPDYYQVDYVRAWQLADRLSEKVAHVDSTP